MEWTKDAIDRELRDVQVEFKKDRSYTEQTAALRVIVKQIPLYVCFTDYKKAFNSTGTADLNSLRHDSAPGEI